MALLLLLAWSAEAPAFRVPPGFAVVEVAGDALAHDIHCMTLDPRGRPVVAGPGYVKILTEPDAAGKFRAALPFAEGPRVEAMGLLWEGDGLFAVGPGGLLRYRSKSGDRADGPPEIVKAVKAEGEHHAHAVKRGPDGWLYLIAGDGAGIDAKWAGPRSPVKEPVGGCVVRFSPDFKTAEIVADGFRNAYDFDFNPDGELFAWDSDNERCIGLPWYQGCQFFHVMSGAHHGWQAPQRGTFWKMPPYWFQRSAPLADLGRGSPTGVVCYRHAQFPPDFRGGFFLLDWTFGRIHFMKMAPRGASYVADAISFLKAEGAGGFAPVAGVVDPKTGDLLVAVGGRGTRGGIYRIRYLPGFGNADPAAVAALQPPPRSLEKPNPADLLSAADAADLSLRRRALEVAARWPEAVEAAAWRPLLEPCLGSADKPLRQAASRAARRLPESAFRWTAGRTMAQTTRGELALFWARRTPPADFMLTPLWAARRRLQAEPTAEAATEAFEFLWNRSRSPSPESRGTWREAFPQRLGGDDPPTEAAGALRVTLQEALPRLSTAPVAVQRPLHREWARLADASDEDFPPRRGQFRRRTWVAPPLFAWANDAEDDIHMLGCLAAARAQAPTAEVVAALLGLDEKLRGQGTPTDRNWPLRMREIHEALAEIDPELNAALLKHPQFGRPAHALWALAPSFKALRAKAAAKLLAYAERHPDEPCWTPALVQLVAELPAKDALAKLRAQWDQLGLREDILTALARQPATEDRAMFVAGLDSPQPATVERCLAALHSLGPEMEPPHLAAVLRAHDEAAAGQNGVNLRAKALAALAAGTGKTFPTRAAWGKWFAEAHPAAAKQAASARVDWPAWRDRLARIDWDAGNADRGVAAFRQFACAGCHAGQGALGPNLAGIGGRFGREDRFIATCDPNRDVPARYRATMVRTKDGRSVLGIVVYEAADGLLLQTGPDGMVRIDAGEIESQQVSRRSLMPEGLLDRAADRDLADLDAYLRSLGTPR